MESKFDRQILRENTRSVKWDLVKTLYGSNDVLPMWVADMDFLVPEEIKKALIKRAAHGVFGYTFTDPALNKLVTNWLEERFQWKVSAASIMYSPGVIPTLNMAIQAFTKMEDKILIQTPVYPPFHDSITNNNRQVVENPLILKGAKYEIDFEDMENKLKDGVKAFVLCNPHNPVGRVWTLEELTKMAELCKKYDVLIISDEIHADIVYAGHRHVPIASIDPELKNRTITCLSPTKTFNLAGLQVSYAVVENEEMRSQLEKTFHKNGLHMINTMGITALEVAYQHGHKWVDELVQYLETNVELVEYSFANTNVRVIKPEGTYLIWLDFRALGLEHEELKDWLVKSAKVALNDGITYGKAGEGFMRLNIAAPNSVVTQAVHRIKQALRDVAND